MKHLAILILAVVAAILIRICKNHKMQLIVGFLLCITLFSLFLTIRDADGLVSFNRSTNQLFYQPEFIDEGLYPDAFMPLLVKGKTIYTKDDINYFDYEAEDDSHWEVRLGEINYGRNSKSLLETFGAETIADSALNDIIVTDEYLKDFQTMGLSNDMFRSSCAVNDITSKFGNYFHYYCYYGAFGLPSHVYYHVDDKGSLLNGSDAEFVALWQYVDGGYGEDLFIMDKEYFEEHFGNDRN